MATQTAQVQPKPLDILNYMSAAGQEIASSRATQLKVVKGMDDQEAASNAAQIASEALGTAKTVISDQTEAFKAETDSRVAGIQVEFGSRPELLGTETNRRAKEMIDFANKADAALDQVRASQSKSLLDNPIEYILSRFTLPSDIETYNYFVNKHNNSKAALSELTQASDAAVIAAKRAEKTTSTELAVAKAEAVAAETSYSVARLRGENAGQLIQGNLALNNLTVQELNVAFKVHQARNSDAQLALSQQQAADMHTQRVEAAKRLAEDTENVQFSQDSYNAGARRLGKAEIPSLSMFKKLAATKAKDPDFWVTVAQGADIVAAGGVTNGIQIARSAGDTALMYEGSNATTPVAKFFKYEFNKLKLDPLAPKDKAALSAKLNADITAEAKNQLGRIDPEKDNIYTAPPPAVILQQKRVAESPFIAQSIIPLLTANPNLSLKDSEIMGIAFDYAAKEGFGAASKDNFERVVRGINSYYQTAVLSNKLNKQFVEHNLPEQKTYNAVIDGAVVDLTSPEDVKRSIILHYTKSMQYRLTGFPVSPAPR